MNDKVVQGGDFGHPLILVLPATLICSIGFYGLVKKVAPLSSFFGLMLETGILFLPALAYLAFEEIQGAGKFLHASVASDLFMVGQGLSPLFHCSCSPLPRVKFRLRWLAFCNKHYHDLISIPKYGGISGENSEIQPHILGSKTNRDNV